MVLLMKKIIMKNVEMFIPPEEVQVPVITDIKRSQSIISLQVKTRNQECEKIVDR